MTKKWTILTSVLVSALLVAACSSSSQNPDEPAGANDAALTTATSAATSPDNATPRDSDSGVSIDNFAFGPDAITISVGGTITWTNEEAGIAHTTSSNDGIWSSPLLNAGDTFDQTFDEAGTFTYICAIHPSMTASITVNG